jgi:hypothetical protein
VVALREYEHERPAPSRTRRRQQAVISIFRPRGISPREVLPFVRNDALPGRGDHYVDTGCELATACLSCPLPRCQYDAPNSVRRWLLEARDREIALLRRKHHAPIEALMRTYGVSKRTIFRILAQDRAGTNA